MENIDIANYKTMTVRDVADILGVSQDLVKKRIRELFPKKMKNGKLTLLNEVEVTAIKKRIEQNSYLTSYDNRNRLAKMPKTKLEKQLIIQQAIKLQQEMISDLENEIQELKPKAEVFDKLIDRGNSTNIRTTAKELGIPERKFVKLLLNDGFLFRDSKGKLKPYAEGIKKHLFEIKEWVQEEMAGVQTLITFEGKQYFLKKYK